MPIAGVTSEAMRYEESSQVAELNFTVTELARYASKQIVGRTAPKHWSGDRIDQDFLQAAAAVGDRRA